MMKKVFIIEWDAEMGHSSKNAIEILNQHGYRAKAGDHSLRDAVLEALPIARPMNCNGRTYLDSQDTQSDNRAFRVEKH